MDLTLELEQQPTLFRVLCGEQMSHTFDLLTLVLSEKEAVQGIVQDPVAYGKRLYMALFPPNSLARRTLERGATRWLLVAKHAAVAAVPWELTYGSADFLVRELSFERGLPPMLPDQKPFISQEHQFFEHIRTGASEDSKPLLAGMLFTMAEIYYGIWHEQYAPPAKDLYFAALALYRELGERASEALTLKRLGDASSHSWVVEPALPFFSEALALYRELGDREHEALLLYELGGHYHRVEYMKPAFEVNSEALPIFRELGDREHEAFTLYNMAADSNRMVSKQQAIELYREALARCHEVGGKEQFEVILLHGLADRLRDMQQYAEALVVCEQLIQFEKDRSSVEGVITGLVMKGVILCDDLKRPAEALPVVEQLLTHLRSRKDPGKVQLYKLLLQRRAKILQSLSRTSGGR